MRYTLLDGVTALGQGGIVTPLPSRPRTGPVQVSGIGTATVVIRGRLSAAYGWTDIVTFTADGAQEISLFPEMQAEVTAYTSGTIDAGLEA